MTETTTASGNRPGRGLALLLALVAAGLTAGVFADWAQTVMPGLATTDDRTFVGVFQALDRAILGPPFLLAFTGALVFTGVAVVLSRRDEDRSVLVWATVALGLHVAAFVVTVAVHEPLNTVARYAGDPAVVDVAAVRAAVDETRWAAWHVVRTLAATVAFGCLARALVLHGRATASRTPSYTGSTVGTIIGRRR